MSGGGQLPGSRATAGRRISLHQLSKKGRVKTGPQGLHVGQAARHQALASIFLLCIHPPLAVQCSPTWSRRFHTGWTTRAVRSRELRCCQLHCCLGHIAVNCVAVNYIVGAASNRTVFWSNRRPLCRFSPPAPCSARLHAHVSAGGAVWRGTRRARPAGGHPRQAPQVSSVYSAVLLCGVWNWMASIHAAATPFVGLVGTLSLTFYILLSGPQLTPHPLLSRPTGGWRAAIVMKSRS